jgi:fumarylacetoacetase
VGTHRVPRAGILDRRERPVVPPPPWSESRTGFCSPPSRAVQRLDYELELAIFVGPGNALGEPVDIDDAEEHLFGVGLLNDWSARDVQAWEYQPLGPFLSKNFASTLSPWIVTMEALAPFRAPFTRSDADPQPLPYLDGAVNRTHGAVDIVLEVLLHTQRMRAEGHAPQRLTRTNTRDAAYWTPAQMLAHHTVNGCNLQAGDLFGSGTLSGTSPEEAGSLLEMTSGGEQLVHLVNGEARTFLEEGDTVILRGYCERPGAVRIGLGEEAGTVIGR